MPRIETVYRLFVASPSDVAEERALVEEVVGELNTTWSKHFNLRIEVVRWETHVFPGFGHDPQAVINQQLDDDYDIFLGLLWTRFGTPTPRNESGTGEEFARAYERYQANPSAVRIMFYFKTAPVDPTTIDPDQIRYITNFRNQLGPKGGLYWTFTDREEFATLLRMHLSRQVQELASLSRDSQVSDLLHDARVALSGNNRGEGDDPGSDEAGLLDLVQQGVEGFEGMGRVLQELTFETQAYNARVVERTREIEAAVAISSSDPRPLWRAAKVFAEEMESFAARIDQARPAYASAREQAFASLSGAVAISRDFDSTDPVMPSTLERLQEFIEVNEETRTIMADFRQTVANQPRLSTLINRARRKMVSSLDALATEMIRTSALGRNVESEIRAISSG